MNKKILRQRHLDRNVYTIDSTVFNITVSSMENTSKNFF